MEHRGLRVRHALFEEPLDLRGCRSSIRFELRYCRFTRGLNLISADLLSLYLKNSVVSGELEASRLTLRGPLFLEKVKVEGRINLDLAKIDAEIYMADTTIKPTSGPALIINGAQIGALRFHKGFTAYGEIQILASLINGQVNF